MPKLPRLNQTAMFFKSDRVGDFGERRLLPGKCIPCRYNITDGTVQIQEGQDKKNIVELHTDYHKEMDEGDIFRLSNNLTYVITARYHTADLNGKFFKTYCELKEEYVELSN